MMSQETWDQQTEKTQKIILEAMKETTAWNSRNSIKMNQEQLELIDQHSSIKIHKLTEDQKQEWKKVLDPAYEELSPIIGKEIVEDMKKLRVKYESQTKDYFDKGLTPDA